MTRTVADVTSQFPGLMNALWVQGCVSLKAATHAALVGSFDAKYPLRDGGCFSSLWVPMRKEAGVKRQELNLCRTGILKTCQERLHISPPIWIGII